MSQENVETVRRLYEAVALRDTFSLYDADLEWDATRSRWSEVLDVPTTFRGHAGLRAFFRHYFEMWETFEDELQELIDTGEKVISVVTSRGRGRSSGIEIEWSGQAGLWTIRTGKIVHVAWFPTREEALEAARGSA
ncbi:MAG: nuclear transport factor 2 family protein [Actinomycetota bacterium]|nr:nuclear transport factor 2 family protein [Actinomycetota bacterium]